MKVKGIKLTKAVELFLTKINIVLLEFANYLQRKSNKMSSRTKKIFLCIFCCAVICECTSIAIKSFNKRTAYVFPSMVVKNLPEPKDLKADKIISKSEFERIRRLKFYLDTLSGPKKDTLLMMRPHLLDTLNYLENIYLKQ